jgi:hypothetical protein
MKKQKYESKSDEDSNQKIGKTIKLDDVHWQIVNKLMPFYGNSESEVVRTIVMMWIHDNIGSDAIRKLEELNAVHLK